MDRSPDGGAWAEREYSLSMGEHVRMLQREREWAAAAAAAQTVGPSRLFPYPLGQAHERGGVFHWPGPFGYNRLEASTSASQAGALEAATTMSSSSSARVGSGRSGARLGIRHAIRGVLGGELRPQSEELEYIEYPEDVLPPEELMPEPPPRRTSVSDVSHQSGREASAPAAVTTAESGGGSGSAALLRSMRRSGVTKSTTERAMTSPPLGSRDSGCPEAADVGGAAGSSVTPDTKQSDSSGGDRERVGALLDSGARISACCARGDLPAHQPLTPMQTFRTLRGAGVGRRAGAAAPSMPTAERQTRWASSADGTRSSPPTITPALPTTVNANITARGGTLAAPRLAPAPPPLASMGMEPMDYPRAAPAVTTAAAPGTRWQALRFGRCKWLLTALLWFSLLLRLYWTLPSTPFCDTGEDPATSHGPCRVCPPHGHCAGGVLSCAGGYVVLGAASARQGRWGARVRRHLGASPVDCGRVARGNRPPSVHGAGGEQRQVGGVVPAGAGDHRPAGHPLLEHRAHPPTALSAQPVGAATRTLVATGTRLLAGRPAVGVAWATAPRSRPPTGNTARPGVSAAVGPETRPSTRRRLQRHHPTVPGGCASARRTAGALPTAAANAPLEAGRVARPGRLARANALRDLRRRPPRHKPPGDMSGPPSMSMRGARALLHRGGTAAARSAGSGQRGDCTNREEVQVTGGKGHCEKRRRPVGNSPQLLFRELHPAETFPSSKRRTMPPTEAGEETGDASAVEQVAEQLDGSLQTGGLDESDEEAGNGAVMERKRKRRGKRGGRKKGTDASTAASTEATVANGDASSTSSVAAHPSLRARLRRRAGLPHHLGRVSRAGTPAGRRGRRGAQGRRGASTGARVHATAHPARRAADRHVRAAGGGIARADRSGRTGGGHRLPHRLLAESRRRSLHAQQGRHDGVAGERRDEGGFRGARPWPHHGLRFHRGLRRAVRAAAGGGARGHQRRCARGRHRRASERYRCGRAGGDGEPRDRTERPGASCPLRAQPQRTQHRPVSHSRRQDGAHRARAGLGTYGGERVLRHRDVRLHRTRSRARRGRVLALHESVRCADHAAAAAARPPTVQHHQQAFRDVGVLSAVSGPAGRGAVSAGAETSV
eukprot:ctg_1240.g418